MTPITEAIRKRILQIKRNNDQNQQTAQRIQGNLWQLLKNNTLISRIYKKLKE
jgi:hypothetical protein